MLLDCQGESVRGCCGHYKSSPEDEASREACDRGAVDWKVIRQDFCDKICRVRRNVTLTSQKLVRILASGNHALKVLSLTLNNDLSHGSFSGRSRCDPLRMGISELVAPISRGARRAQLRPSVTSRRRFSEASTTNGSSSVKRCAEGSCPKMSCPTADAGSTCSIIGLVNHSPRSGAEVGSSVGILVPLCCGPGVFVGSYWFSRGVGGIEPGEIRFG